MRQGCRWPDSPWAEEQEHRGGGVAPTTDSFLPGVLQRVGLVALPGRQAPVVLRLDCLVLVLQMARGPAVLQAGLLLCLLMAV